MPATAYASSYCYRGGLFGYAVWWLAMLQPLFVWVALGSRAFDPIQRVYYTALGKTSLVSWAIYFLLRDEVLRMAPPDPSCNSSRYSMPSLEMVWLVQYLVCAVLHNAYFGAKIWTLGLVRTLLLLAFVYGGASWSGNYRQSDLWVGAALGVVCGAVAAFLIYVVILPREPYLRLAWWSWRTPLGLLQNSLSYMEEAFVEQYGTGCVLCDRLVTATRARARNWAILT